MMPKWVFRGTRLVLIYSRQLAENAKTHVSADVIMPRYIQWRASSLFKNKHLLLALAAYKSEESIDSISPNSSG
jgi:hypothetical protein